MITNTIVMILADINWTLLPLELQKNTMKAKQGSLTVEGHCV